MALVREGRRRGCTMVLTHCDNTFDYYTVEQQVDIARRKGGIPEGAPLTLERFEVVRHV